MEHCYKIAAKMLNRDKIPMSLRLKIDRILHYISTNETVSAGTLTSGDIAILIEQWTYEAPPNEFIQNKRINDNSDDCYDDIDDCLNSEQ